jgi:hypothetical protein
MMCAKERMRTGYSFPEVMSFKIPQPPHQQLRPPADTEAGNTRCGGAEAVGTARGREVDVQPRPLARPGGFMMNAPIGRLIRQFHPLCGSVRHCRCSPLVITMTRWYSLMAFSAAKTWGPTLAASSAGISKDQGGRMMQISSSPIGRVIAAISLILPHRPVRRDSQALPLDTDTSDRCSIGGACGDTRVGLSPTATRR